MISVGIDVSKEKSTICILKPYEEIVSKPFEMKEYRCQGLRRVKTDKQDAVTISNYGIDHWYRLKEYEPEESIYAELKLLGRQYRHYMRMRGESVLELTHLLDVNAHRLRQYCFTRVDLALVVTHEFIQ